MPTSKNSEPSGRQERVDYGSCLSRARLPESCRSRTSLTGHNRTSRSVPQSGLSNAGIDPELSAGLLRTDHTKREKRSFKGGDGTPPPSTISKARVTERGLTKSA